MEDLRGTYEHPETGYQMNVEIEPEGIRVSILSYFKVIRMPGIHGHPSELEFRSAHQNLCVQEAEDLLSPLGFRRDSLRDRWTDRGDAFVSCWVLHQPDGDRREKVRRFLESCTALTRSAA